MKKTVILLFVISLLLPFIFAQSDCPFGEEDCEYPGKCGGYNDGNNDGICDDSQESLEQIPRQTSSQLETLKILKQIQGDSRRTYYFLQILIITTIFYALTAILSRIGKMKVITHKRIWNMVLLISFLISGILGILLVIRIQSGIDLSLGINKLFWHVEAGILMTVISVFHIIWHMPYWKTYFKRR